MTASPDLATSPFLLGAFAPVAAETTTVRLPVSGRLPGELDGLFTQIGPNPITSPRHTDTDRYQWFAQDGMVSGVRIRDGQAQWFRNRWIRSTKVTRTLHVPRTPGPRHFPIDTVHTNIVGHGGMLLALVETGCSPVQLGSELQTLRYTDLDGALPRGLAAHPKLDPRTGELHAIVYSPMRTWAEYTVLASSGALRSSVRIPLGGRPMMHDIALTQRHVLLFDLPVRFGFTAAARGRFPYHWDERHQTRLGVLRRGGGREVRWFDIPSCFVFHTINAYDVGDKIVLRAVRYRRLFDTGAGDPLSSGGQLWEWTINLTTGTVSERQLDDRLQELPRINPHRLTAPTRYHYALTADGYSNTDHAPEALMKHDDSTGLQQLRTARPGTTPSEAIFIPRPCVDGLAAEDDGWIAYFAYEGHRGASDLVILDARDFTGDPVATITLPIRVPFGFHSSWIAFTNDRPG